jgi:ankyrin repeat protein
LPKLEQNALVEAAKQGDAGTVQRLLARRVDVNAPPPGRRALDYAITSGHENIVAPLLAHGAMIQPGGSFATDPLAEAVGSRQPNIVKTLLAHGANANALDSDGSQTMLILAFLAHDPAVMRALLEGGADPNRSDKVRRTTPLMWAARGGESTMVADLIAHGAHVNARDGSGMTVLTYGVLGGHLPVIKYLVSQGADVKASTSGLKGRYTDLMLAEQDLQIVRKQQDEARASDRANFVQGIKQAGAIVRFLKQSGAKG